MLERHESPDGAVVHRSPALAELGVPHAFTTRRGPGGSELDVGDLDGGLAPRGTGVGAPALAALLGRLAGAEGRAVVAGKQVHGAAVREVGAEPWPGEPPEVDALVTSRADRLVLVRTADCVPVLLASADGRRVAAVHAGWRGLVAGVIPSALEVLAASEVVAAIGPCLSLARFEVGPEVAESFERAELGATVKRFPGRRPHVDLRAAAAIQLERAGVARIEASELCTWEHVDELWSYRRDVTHGPRTATGRLAAVIGTAAEYSAGRSPERAGSSDT